MSKKASPEGKIAAHGNAVTQCPKHTNKPVTLACLTCKLVICKSCGSDHDGHDVKPCERDGRLVQTICRSQTQHFYDILEILENLNDGKDKKAAVFQEAKTKVREKIQHVITEATNLLKQIDDAIDAAYKHTKHGSKIGEHIKRVDDRIGRLNSIRNVKDAGVLIPEAVDNAVLLEEFKTIEEGSSDTTPETLTFDDVLPNLHKLDGVIEDMKNTFKVEIKTDTTDSAAVEYTHVGNVDISNKTSSYYRICDTDLSDPKNCGVVEIFGLRKNDMQTFEVRLQQLTRKTYSTTGVQFYSGVKMSENKYAVLDTDSNNVHLLDDKQVLYTQKSEGGIDLDLCYHSPNKLIKLNKITKARAKLSRCNVSSGKFVTEHEIEINTKDTPGFICTTRDKNIINMVSDQYLYTVNMLTSNVDTHDISDNLSGENAYSMHVDKCWNIFVGDKGGNIHMFDTDRNHRVVAKADDTIWGITTRNEELFVTAKGKIWRYKLSRK